MPTNFVLLRFLFLFVAGGWRQIAAHFLIKNVSATPKVDGCYDTLVWIRADLAVYCPVSALAHVGFVEQETFDVRSAVESHAKCKSITPTLHSPVLLPGSGNGHRRNHFVQYVT
jgi:hypothetical protein